MTGLCLTSCDHFLTGAQTRDQLEKQIDYANAPSYEITVGYPKKSGVVKSPGGGEAKKKVSDVFTVCFEPFADYEFINWKIIDSVSKKEYKNGEYLKLESLTNAETSCTFIKAPEASVHLCLYAEVALRPYILSKTPLYSASRSLRDATIQVMFDHKMDQGSIYFDTEEIGELKTLYNLTDDDFEYINPAKKEKCWCYSYDGDTYFKNITITNYKTNKNINNCFNAPVINNYILTITANPENPPASYSQILVTIEKDFYYKVGTKPVTMGRSEKWNYQVNDKTDKLPPIVNSCSVGLGQECDDKGEFITILGEFNDKTTCPPDSSLAFVKDKKLYLNLEVKDDDGTIPVTFDLIVKKVKDAAYQAVTAAAWETIPVEYLAAGSDEGKFYGPVDLDSLEDGIYSMYLKFTDASSHYCTWPATAENAAEPASKFYFCLDNTVPDPVITYTKTEKTIAITDNAKPSDFKQATIRYKKVNAAEYGSPEEIADYPYEIKNLEAASDYEIEVTSEDNAGNKAVKKIIALTSTPAPVLVQPADDYNTLNSVKITWETVPVDMNKFIITAGNKTVEVSDLTYKESEGTRRYSYTINNLKATTKYPVKVQAVKNRSDGSVEKPESEEKTYCTAPATVIVGEAKPSWDQEKQEWSISFELDVLSEDATYYFYDSYNKEYQEFSFRKPKFSLGTFEGGPIQYKFKTQITDGWDLEDTVETETGTCQIYPYVVIKNIRESAGNCCVCEWTLVGRAGADPYSYKFYVNNSSPITANVLQKPDNSGYYAKVPIGWNKGSGDDIYMEWYFVNEGESTLIGRQKFVFENDICTSSNTVSVRPFNPQTQTGNSLTIQWAAYNPSEAKSIIIRVYDNKDKLIDDNEIEINPRDYMHGYTIEGFKSIYESGTFKIRVTTKNNLDVENTVCTPVTVIIK